MLTGFIDPLGHHVIPFAHPFQNRIVSDASNHFSIPVSLITEWSGRNLLRDEPVGDFSVGCSFLEQPEPVIVDPLGDGILPHIGIVLSVLRLNETVNWELEDSALCEAVSECSAD